MKLTEKQILKLAAKFVSKNKRYPSTPEMLTLGITRNTIRHHFGNVTAMHDKLSQMTGVAVVDLERHSGFAKLRAKTKRFVITSAVVGAQVNKKFYNNIKRYCQDEAAELVVLPSLSPTPGPLVLDPVLKDEVIIMEDTAVNSNVFILSIKNNAKSADPITGLARIGRRNGTFITASPKQRLKYVATGVNKLAHAVMSPGAITNSAYQSKGVLIDQQNYAAHLDHVLGAIILELDKDNTFHFRQIQADEDGTFVDLGTMYKGGKRARMAPAAFVLGDWHSGETDPIAAGCWIDVTKKLKVPRWIIHDGFSGLAINHHDAHKIGTKAKLALENKLSLKAELDGYVADLGMMSGLLKEVVVVASNHDEFLTRYLNEGRYVDDPHNHRLGLELAQHYVDGANPIQSYVAKTMPKVKNIKWLQRDEDYTIAGIQCGAHGDKGADGGRGNINSLENAFGNVVAGHSHTPQIQRGAWIVGTTSLLQLSYNSGPSSWFQTSCLIYPNGQRQLINNIDGKFTTRKL